MFVKEDGIFEVEDQLLRSRLKDEPLLACRVDPIEKGKEYHITW